MSVSRFRYVDESLAAEFNNAPYHRQLALEAARQSQVLLQDGVKGHKSILPIDRMSIQSVAVIGGNADTPQYVCAHVCPLLCCCSRIFTTGVFV
jgi:beta-glucosidase-like glycosyl hydrolase